LLYGDEFNVTEVGMTKEMEKILVTGAGGFIGSHLVERLVSEGYAVRALVRYNSASLAGWLDYSDVRHHPNLEVLFGDIRDADLVQSAVSGCSTVFHLAALIGIPYSYIAPQSYLETNIRGTLNVLQAAVHHSCRRVIHTSTSEVYGSAQYVPIDEKHPIYTQSPYSASKAAADNLALAYFCSFDLPVCVVRPFNTFGPRQSLRAVIPNMICQILDSNDGVIALGAVAPTRDFSFVGQTVEGFVRALHAKEIFGEVINLGTSFEISIGETANLVAEILGKKIQIISDKDRLRPCKSEVTRLYADVRKSKLLLGIGEKEPRELFRKGLEITCQWFQSKNNRSLYKETRYLV
jgi:dTDP-glucose 4,6-dehydratase